MMLIGCWESNFLVMKLMCEVDCLGSMVVRLKFKGIDGGLYKWWMMWINLMQCEGC